MPTEIEPIYKSIGRRIAQHRSHRGLTQAELGEQISPPLTRAAISNLEAGRQRMLLHVFLEISRILRVEPGALLASASSTPSTALLEEQLRALPIGLSKRAIAKLTRAITDMEDDV